MRTDFENGVRKTIDLCVRTEKMTTEILKVCMKEYLDHSAECKGKMTLGNLQKKYSCKLENIEVSEENIKDFLKVAGKYDIDFSLKRERDQEQSVYHVFFSSARTEDFKRAFTEYAENKQIGALDKERGEVSGKILKKEAAEISRNYKKQKIRQRSREVSH